MKRITIERKFKYKKMELPDPNPSLSAAEVLNFYSATYPALTTATLKGPEMINDVEFYTFDDVIGVKG